MFSGSDDSLVKMWCTRSGRLLRSFRGHSGYITDLAVAPDNSLVASCCMVC